MEEKLGRPLQKGEVVHHIDEDKTNDSPENLQLFPTKGAHTRYHVKYLDLRWGLNPGQRWIRVYKAQSYAPGPFPLGNK